MKNNVERRLFVAATNQNDGKTTCSLGFAKGFSGLAESIGFIKPVGQRYVMVNGQMIDEDALLIQQTCGLTYPLKDMSPVAISPSFTRDYIENPDKQYPILEKAIRDSYAVVAKDNDLVVIEGSGHAGVGAVFDMSNAHVAKLLNAKVIIITLGGIGRPVDEVAVNRSLFEKEGVPVIGVIVNKVLPEKLEQTKYYLSKSFERSGLPLLGVIPYMPQLSWPTIQQIVEDTNSQVINGEDRLANNVAGIIVGAMTAHNALTYVKDKTLLIVPGDRDDVILAAITLSLLRKDIELSGIVLTGGLKLQPQTMDLVFRTDIPVLAVEARTYEAASRINDITVKIRLTDEGKTELATSLIHEYVDMDALWTALA